MNVFNGWQRARLCHESLVFETSGGLASALRDGFFYVSIPEVLDLRPQDHFVRSFYHEASVERNNSYAGFKAYGSSDLGPYQGYFARDSDQAEQFFIEKKNWNLLFPLDLTCTSYALLSFTLTLLREIFSKLGVPDDNLQEGTGGCLTEHGTHTYTFNHFRPVNHPRGLNVHKDSGWLTVLRSFDPGLEILRDGAWISINPIEGYFIVNFGCAMEIFTRNLPCQVTAVTHRVVSQPTDRPSDRFSYALFVDTSLSKDNMRGLYEYVPKKGLKYVVDFDQFLKNILNKTYDLKTVGLYE